MDQLPVSLQFINYFGNTQFNARLPKGLKLNYFFKEDFSIVTLATNE